MCAVHLRMLQAGESPGNVVSFGHYRLLVRQRLLVRSGVALEVGDRAFDVLMALVESVNAAPGSTV